MCSECGLDYLYNKSRPELADCARKNGTSIARNFIILYQILQIILLNYKKIRKIQIISPAAYFWSKGLFATFFFGMGGGGGGGLTWTNICILETLFFVQQIVIF